MVYNDGDELAHYTHLTKWFSRIYYHYYRHCYVIMSHFSVLTSNNEKKREEKNKQMKRTIAEKYACICHLILVALFQSPSA